MVMMIIVKIEKEDDYEDDGDEMFGGYVTIVKIVLFCV